MATWETVCAMVAALPATVLDADGRPNPAWRVNSMVLVRRNPHLRVPEEDALRRERGEVVAIRAERGLREALLAANPQTFFVTPHWASSPSVLVWLDTVSTDELHELITEAWRARAPRRLVRAWDTSHTGD